MKLWIARDKDESLYIYAERPKLNEVNNQWYCTLGCFNCQLDESMLPELTFENSPQEIELKLKNELSFEEME